MFAHVRAASEGSVISEQNCHPFRYGRLLFQHNGHIEAFGKIKQRVSLPLVADIHFDYQIALRVAELHVNFVQLRLLENANSRTDSDDIRTEKCGV